MASLNKVFLMGNLTRDPELRYTPSGSAVTDLALAVNRTWTGKDGDRKEEVLFVDVTVWDRQAETCCQYLKKGRGVHVEGSLKLESWDDKTSGEKKSKIKVLAERIQFLDRREDGPGGSPPGDGDYAPLLPPDDRRRAVTSPGVVPTVRIAAARPRPRPPGGQPRHRRPSPMATKKISRSD
jgi:single-strand DNA-binding protein